MQKNSKKEMPQYYKKKILLVDDDPKSLKLLEAMLPPKIYEIIKAENGKEALEFAFEKNPDLILLDIMMPDISGFDVTRKLKKDQRTGNIPIVLITALNDPENRTIGLDAGAEELLNKPIQMTELRTRINSMLRLKQYRDQLSIRVKSEQDFHNLPRFEEASLEPGEGLPLVVLVEDNNTDVKLVQDFLHGQPYRLEVFKTGKDVFSYVEHEKVDLILLDILLPDMNGFEICRRLKKDHKDIQIIIVTCLDDMESKIKGVELGADDFLVKPIVGRELRARIKVLMEKKRHMDTLRSHYKAALDSAIFDWLTGLHNHGYLQQFLGYELKRSLDQGFPVSMIMIDVDNFKLYNDTFGHSAGDAILREIGQIVRNLIREVDIAARYGGEEFAVVLPYANREGATIVAQRIHEAITSHDFFHGAIHDSDNLTVSMGIAVFPEDARSKEDLIKTADRMLYKAKQSGKNRINA